MTGPNNEPSLRKGINNSIFQTPLERLASESAESQTNVLGSRLQPQRKPLFKWPQPLSGKFHPRVGKRLYEASADARTLSSRFGSSNDVYYNKLEDFPAVGTIASSRKTIASSGPSRSLQMLRPSPMLARSSKEKGELIRAAPTISVFSPVRELLVLLSRLVSVDG